MLPRRSHLAVFVFPDEAIAFDAYRLLQSQGISPEHLAIVGEGYSSPERVGLLEPTHIAFRKARRFSLLTGTLGSALGLISLLVFHVGFGLPLSWTLVLMVPAAGLMSGFWGAVAGALIGFLGEGSASGIYRHYLRQGRYLLMMEGPERLVQMGQDILSEASIPRTR